MSDITAWFRGRLPADWFEQVPEIGVDREEILVVGRVPAPEQQDEQQDGQGDDTARRQAEAGRIARFREDTRARRMQIADEAERRFGRKVAWGAACGETRTVFTSLAVPVMTRLRQPERQVLDTLVAAGVARSRAEALAWCVRLVGQHEGDWIERLRAALVAVEEARAAGPA
ncbi:hypothetical protein [Kineococcus glutinatus]|uniref:Uncharacterized protein n=1 Tax=Kineococcus glutinatus TaxID=1070872 RepID=A0ABP9HSZ8_9ACTN